MYPHDVTIGCFDSIPEPAPDNRLDDHYRLFPPATFHGVASATPGMMEEWTRSALSGRR